MGRLSNIFLLAVDLGVRTGLALYGRAGRLIWYRSKNFGSAAGLKRGVKAVLDETGDLTWLIIEGGGHLAEIWEREAEWRGVAVRQISAGDWRSHFLLPREQHSGSQAKRVADDLARQVIDWSGAPRPTSLRHDAAEAILVGLWGVLEVGWLDAPPEALKR